MATLKEESKTALAKPRARACTYTHAHTYDVFPKASILFAQAY